MRYLGSKESLTEPIVLMLAKKGLLQRNLVFFDAFCGMGSVSDAIKTSYDHIVINDSLKCSSTFALGKLYSNECMFEKLDFDPFKFLNENQESRQDFMYKNYSPGGSDRMYFSAVFLFDNTQEISFPRTPNLRKKIMTYRARIRPLGDFID